MRVHCIVQDLETARVAAEGATVIQIRIKGVSTLELVDAGRPICELCREHSITSVVNDDVEAALALNADGVHLGRADPGKELAAAAGLTLGLSATGVYEAIAAQEQGAAYVGAGPGWETPTKSDAGAPIGLDGLAALCEAVNIPVVAIGGVDAANAARCIEAGAKGVAVVRASRDARRVREIVDAAL